MLRGVAGDSVEYPSSASANLSSSIVGSAGWTPPSTVDCSSLPHLSCSLSTPTRRLACKPPEHTGGANR